MYLNEIRLIVTEELASQLVALSTYIKEFQLSHDGVREVSEQAREWSKREKQA